MLSAFDYDSSVLIYFKINITDEYEQLSQRSISTIKIISPGQFYKEKISMPKKSGTTCNI